MEIIERITETLEKTDKKATDLCDRLGIRTSTMSTAEEDELLELYRALPQNKQFEFIGELKGFLKAYTESQKYLDKEKRLSV